MNIKAELLECNKRAHCWKSSLVKQITRYRNGKPVYYGMEADDELYTGVESRRVNGLTKIGEFTVYLPGESADRFCPSSFLAVMQLGFNRDLKHQVLVEFRFPSADISACYDKILECHKVTAILYHDVQNLLQELEQEQGWLEEHLRTRPQIDI